MKKIVQFIRKVESNPVRNNPVLAGHPFTPLGKGEDARCIFRAFQAINAPLAIRDIYSFENRTDPDIKREIGNYLVRDLSSHINIFSINGDEVDQTLKHVKKELPTNAYNIICPHWELSIYPADWAKQIDRFDEIWAPSRFVFESIRDAASKSVINMLSPAEVHLTAFLGRRYFGIPESSYVFLFFFDFRSYIERKNPFAVINAFDKLCSSRQNEKMHLVIKLNRPSNSPQSEMDFQQFISRIGKYKCKDRIIIIDKVFTDNEIKNLVRVCDCFVSLHRSEGFGRGLAEAMFLGKPVVATAYSGNLDFMNEENSCLVRYELIDVIDGQYPYADGQVWADPDIDHAVLHMEKLVDDKAYGRELGEIASRHIRTYFSYRAAGHRYKKRIDEIENKHRNERG